MAKKKQRTLQEERIVGSRRPESQPQTRQDTGVAPKEPARIKLQRQVGNQAVQRLMVRGRKGVLGQSGGPVRAQSVQRQTPEETVTKGAKIPGVAGSGKAAKLGDILTVLDTGLTLADIAGMAVEGIGAKVLGAGTAAAGVTLAASIAFVVASMYGLAEAYKTGEKWAAVQGESYAIVHLAHGKDPPPAPGWMKAGAAFNRAAQQAKQRISNVVKKRDPAARHMLNVLLSVQQNPEAALNRIYQHLVARELQAKFLWWKVGGRLYHIAKSYRLNWPEVKAIAED